MTISFETFKPIPSLNIQSLVSRFKILGGQWGDQANDIVNEPLAADHAAFANLAVKERLKDATFAKTPPKALKVFTSEELRTLRAELLILFHDAEEYVFEDGMESDFSRKLLAWLEEAHADMVMNQIILLVEDDSIAPEVLAETLRWLGQMADGSVYAHRRWLLEHCLHHPSVCVRDGAILGLSFLEDPRIIPALERALSQEPLATLRSDIEQVLEDLREILP